MPAAAANGPVLSSMGQLAEDVTHDFASDALQLGSIAGRGMPDAVLEMEMSHTREPLSHHFRFFLPLLPLCLLDEAAELDAAPCCFACASRFAFSDLPGCRGHSSATFSYSTFPAHQACNSSSSASLVNHELCGALPAVIQSVMLVQLCRSVRHATIEK